MEVICIYIEIIYMHNKQIPDIVTDYLRLWTVDENSMIDLKLLSFSTVHTGGPN